MKQVNDVIYHDDKYIYIYLNVKTKTKHDATHHRNKLYRYGNVIKHLEVCFGKDKDTIVKTIIDTMEKHGVKL